MKLWLFLFASEASEFESIRIAADSRTNGIMLAQSVLPGIELFASPSDPVADGVFCSYAGVVPNKNEGIISCIPRRGAYAGKRIVPTPIDVGTANERTEWLPSPDGDEGLSA